MFKQCPICNKNNYGDANFCEKCGARFLSDLSTNNQYYTNNKDYNNIENDNSYYQKDTGFAKRILLLVILIGITISIILFFTLNFSGLTDDEDDNDLDNYQYVFIIQDDGSNEAEIKLDYNDDYIEKIFELTQEEVDKTDYVNLLIYGKAHGEYKDADSHSLKINNVLVENFNPFDYYDLNEFSWAVFNISKTYFQPGENTVYIKDTNSPSNYNLDPWQIDNLYIGIDTDNDQGNSHWIKNGSHSPDVPGELMIRLELIY